MSCDILRFSLLIVCLAGCNRPPATSLPLEDAQLESAKFTVVELFTSQGCSSCPPADRALANLVEWSEQQELPVYFLSFHVDYWNQLGWTDPYSDGRFTQRQRDYVDVLKNRRPYTPQMIVNGKSEFIGAREQHAKEVIAAALSELPQAAIELNAKVSDRGSAIDVEYEVRGLLEDSILNLALIEPLAENPVSSGENAGRSLSHAHVVRAYKSTSIERKARGRLTLRMPKGVAPESVRLIGYSQDRSTHRITGGSGVSFFRSG